MVMTAAQTAYQIKTSRDAAAKQAKLAKEQAAAIERSAKEARAIDLATAEQRSKEIKQAGASKQFERARQAAREAAKLRLSSAEAGVFGTSVYRQLASSTIQGDYDIGLVGADIMNALKQNDLLKQDIEAKYASRMSDAKMTRKSASLYKGPSVLGAGLELVSAAGQGFLKGHTMGSSLKNLLGGST